MPLPTSRHPQGGSALSSTAARKREAGFALVEVLVAILILSVGMISLATLVIRASATTSEVKAREGATNLAREVVEATLSLPYATLTPDQVTGTLQAKPALAPAPGYSGWTVLRRGIAYTLSVNGCYLDDPSDGLGAHDANFCAGSTTGSADTSSIDYKRFNITVSWTRRNLQRSVTQTTLVAPKGARQAPSITSLTSNAGLVITDPARSNVTFTATTSSTSAGVLWTLDDSNRGTASGSGTSWSFTWDISGLSDGQYVVGAKAFNSAGEYGTPISVTVTLNRTPPGAPQGFVAGYNNTTTKVDTEWLASPDLDVVGYTVYRQQTAPSAGAVQQVNCGSVASPLYVVPDTDCTDASPITASSSGAGTVQFRGTTSAQVSNAQWIGFPVPAGTSVGDVLVATIVVDSNPGISAMSGWTLIRSTSTGTGSARLQEASFYHVAAAGEPGYAFWTSNGSNRNFVGGVTAYSNVDTTSPVTASGATTGSSGNAVSPNLSVSFSGSRVINAVAMRSVASGGTVTPDASINSERYDRNLNSPLGEYADGNQAAAGTTGTKTATASSSNGGWISQLLVLKPGGGGTGSLAVNYWVVPVDRDAAGAYREGSASNVVNAYAQNVAPTPIAGLTCTNNADGSNTLNWTQPAQPGDPDSGDRIAFDRIYRDDARFDRTGSGTDATFTDPNPGGEHEYYVTTVDTHLTEAAPTGTVTC
jgi:Tfp pilus assembly protein PilV